MLLFSLFLLFSLLLGTNAQVRGKVDLRQRYLARHGGNNCNRAGCVGTRGRGNLGALMQSNNMNMKQTWARYNGQSSYRCFEMTENARSANPECNADPTLWLIGGPSQPVSEYYDSDFRRTVPAPVAPPVAPPVPSPTDALCNSIDPPACKLYIEQCNGGTNYGLTGQCNFVPPACAAHNELIGCGTNPAAPTDICKTIQPPGCAFYLAECNGGTNYGLTGQCNFVPPACDAHKTLIGC